MSESININSNNMSDKRTIIDMINRCSNPIIVIFVSSLDNQADIITEIKSAWSAPISRNRELTFGKFLLDLELNKITYDDKEIHLSRIEYDLLKVLIANEGKTMSFKELLNTIWGDSYNFENDYLHVYVSSLQNKLRRYEQNKYVINVRGIGYRWNSELFRRQ